MYYFNNNLGLLFFTMILFIWLVIYFLPTIVASIRKNNSLIPIFILNFFLGWSFVAWVIAIIWAFSGDNRNDLEQKLRKLNYLKNQGIISEKEYEEKKEDLINSILD